MTGKYCKHPLKPVTERPVFKAVQSATPPDINVAHTLLMWPYNKLDASVAKRLLCM